jgi:hypothetical protein
MWKQLFVNGGECRSPVSTETEVLNSLQEEQIINLLRDYAKK